MSHIQSKLDPIYWLKMINRKTQGRIKLSVNTSRSWMNYACWQHWNTFVSPQCSFLCIYPWSYVLSLCYNYYLPKVPFLMRVEVIFCWGFIENLRIKERSDQSDFSIRNSKKVCCFDLFEVLLPILLSG